MELGDFSVSLTVKDIKASKAFYEKLDFKEVGGKLEENWIVLQNGNARIGLFQGMFDKNIPQWQRADRRQRRQVGTAVGREDQ